MASLAQKLSISLPSHLVGFVKEYKAEHNLRSDSEVMALALKNLEKTYLEFCYSQSAQELKMFWSSKNGHFIQENCFSYCSGLTYPREECKR